MSHDPPTLFALKSAGAQAGWWPWILPLTCIWRSVRRGGDGSARFCRGFCGPGEKTRELETEPQKRHPESYAV